MESSQHFKMYKKGKQWCTMALASVMVGLGALATTQTTANADTTTTTDNSVDTTQTSDTSNDVQTNSVTLQSGSDSTSASNVNTTGSDNSSEQSSQSNSNSNSTVHAPLLLYSVQTNNDSTTKNGVVSEDGSNYYYVNGQKQTDYFYTNDSGQVYYFGDDGKMYQDQFYSNWGNMYYFGEDGARYTDQFYNNWGNTYYFDENGVRYTNQFYSNWGNTYYFDEDGVLYRDEEYDNWGNKYWFDADGVLATNTTVSINGTDYVADANGVLSESGVSAAVAKAMTALGIPYVWGGNTTAGFDCSGLVQWAYGLSSAYRTTYTQQTLGTHVYSNVSAAPYGALLFFGSDSAPYHVAISLGDGTYINAPEPGDVVKINSQKYFAPSYYVVIGQQLFVRNTVIIYTGKKYRGRKP